MVVPAWPVAAETLVEVTFDSHQRRAGPSCTLSGPCPPASHHPPLYRQIHTPQHRPSVRPMDTTVLPLPASMVLLSTSSQPCLLYHPHSDHPLPPSLFPPLHKIKNHLSARLSPLLHYLILSEISHRGDQSKQQQIQHCRTCPRHPRSPAR